MNEEIMVFTNAEKNGPFQLQCAGTSYCDGSYKISRRNASLYVFEFVEKGSGYLRINEHEFTPEAGDVYIVPYGSDHEYGSSKKNPWTKHWFNVSGKLVGDLLSDYQLNNIFLFKNYPMKKYFLDGLELLKNNHHEASNLLGPQIILNLILRISAHRDYLHEKKSISPLSKKLQILLEKHVFAQALTLEEMCEHIKLSPAQTNRIFKKDFGQTPYQYLLKLKINAAEELLKTSVKNIKEIAFILGFNDEYYFSNIFKRKTGLAPKNYRNQAAL